MKTIKSTAVALTVLIAGFSAEAQAGVINLNGDTTQGFGTAVLGGEYIGEGGMVRLNPDAAFGADEAISGAVTLDFDFRQQPYHVGLAGIENSSNGTFTLMYGDVSTSFESHNLGSDGIFTTNAFDGVIAGGDWIVRLDAPNAADPWAAFSVNGSFDTALAGGGAGDGTGGAGGAGAGGNGGAGGGQVPAPAPLTLIGAMALLGAWRRKRSTAG